MRTRWIVTGIVILGVLAVAGCSRQADPVASTPPPEAGLEQPPEAELEDAPGEAEDAKQRLDVAVACGVAGPYGQIKEKFEEAHPDVEVHQHVGNIVPMAKGIRDGKLDADLFMTIGTVALADLQADGLLYEDPIPFAEDRLVVLVPEGNPAGLEKIEDLSGDAIETLAIAKGMSTPGRFAEMALKRAGVYEQVQDRLVRPDQPAMLKGFVANNKADAAVMLLTCATKEAEMGDEPAEGTPGTEIAFEVPHEYYDKLMCKIGILKDASDPDLAREFAEFLADSEPQKILSDWDFFPCETEPSEDSTEA